MNDRIFIEIARRSAANEPAHDFSHVMRVYANANTILQIEPADAEVVRTAVLLHELFNYPKNHPDSHLSGDVCAEKAAVVLHEVNFPKEKRELVLDCIRNHSFSKGIVPSTIEGKIVQDADRLDALGAIGIARCFATCGTTGGRLYNVDDVFHEHRPLDDKQFALDHFDNKLLKLAGSFHTVVANQMAQVRHEFLLQFVAQLKDELQFNTGHRM